MLPPAGWIIDIVDTSPPLAPPYPKWQFDDIFFGGHPSMVNVAQGQTPLYTLTEIAIDPDTGDPKQGPFNSENNPLGHKTGVYRYKIKFGIHKKRAILSHLFDVKFVLSTKDPVPWGASQNNVDVPDGWTTPEKLHELLDKQASATANLIDSVKDNIIWEENISIRDILGYTESDAFGDALAAAGSQGITTMKIRPTSVKIVKRLTKSDLSHPHYKTPVVLEKQLKDVLVMEEDLAAKEPPKKSLLNLIKAGGGPCLLVDQTYFFKAASWESGYTATANFGGTDASAGKYFPASEKAIPKASNNELLVGSTAINSKAKKPLLDLQAAFVDFNPISQSDEPFIIETPSWCVWKEFEIEIDKDATGIGDLYLQAILMRKESKTIVGVFSDVTKIKSYQYRYKSYTMTHAQEIKELTEPELSPSIKVYRPWQGFMKIVVEQRDNWAVGVKVERNITWPHTAANPDGLAKLHTITPSPYLALTKTMGPIELTDMIDTTGADHIEYIVYAIGALPDQNKPMNSTVIGGAIHPTDEVSNPVPPSASVDATVTATNKITVNVTSVNTSFSYIQVLKEVWSNRGFIDHYSTPHTIIRSSEDIPGHPPAPVDIASATDDYVFIDDADNMVNGQIFRYYVRYYDSEGNIVLSTGSKLITYLMPLSNPPYFPTVDLVSVTPWGSGPTPVGGYPPAGSYQVILDLTATSPAGTVTSKMLSELVSEMLGPEESTTYAQDFQNHNRSLQELAAFHVTRRNLDTDDVFDMGVWLPGLVTDQPTRPPPNPQNQPMHSKKYRYKVELLLRPPAFLFPNKTVSMDAEDDMSNMGESGVNGTFFTKLQSKIQQTYTEFLGGDTMDILHVDENNFGPAKGLSADVEFRAGRTGIFRAVDANTIPNSPEITDIKKMNHTKKNKFGWRVHGSTVGIHSYLITAHVASTGLIAPIGYVPHSDNCPAFNAPGGIFVDTSNSNTVSYIRYAVHIMHTNYSFTGPNSNSMVGFDKWADNYVPWKQDAEKDMKDAGKAPEEEPFRP